MSIKFKFLFFTILLLSPLSSLCKSSEEEVEDQHEFDYLQSSNRGPQHWSELNTNWSHCANGKMQSPIDLLNKRVVVLPNLGKLKRNYKPAPAVLKNRGHDIMLSWSGDAGAIYINGIAYYLNQCHWHSPSEHTFNGSRYELELHMVHESSNGEIAVVGITYKYGRRDTFLEQVILGANGIGAGDKNVGLVNPWDIKIGSRKYYRYIGSLTVPPCTEGVIWTMVRKVRTVSREQVSALREAVHDGFEVNARPVQQIEDRTVWFYTPNVS